ncbi:MAG: hypothetical protein IJU70_01075 [Lentisphaeria bacterium]|nr:hypothetical protein [Lentisphaeria bacterium]
MKFVFPASLMFFACFAGFCGGIGGLETRFEGEHVKMLRHGKVLDFKDCLTDLLKAHPAMKADDVYLLCFEGACGLDPMEPEGQVAKASFDAGFASASPRPDQPLFELVSPDVMRVDLGAWKAKKLPSEWLFNLFRLSQGRFSDRDAVFRSYLDQAENVLKGDLRERFIQRRRGSGPVRHSLTYLQEERPSYRLVSTRFLFALPVLVRAAALPETGVPRIIAVDGRAASGKTTLARQLAGIMDSGVVHMDDFFLPLDLRTPARYREPGGNVHYERFAEEVLPYLKKSGKFTYRAFDCSTMGYGKSAEVKDSLWRIVEGAYSLHPKFGDYADFKVFYDISPEEQKRRIIRRNGEVRYRVFEKRWIPLEENYIRNCRVRERADLVIGCPSRNGR